MIEEKVFLGERSYPIYIGGGAINLAREHFAGLAASGRRCAAVADSRVVGLYPGAVSSLAEIARVFEKDGTEATKTFAHLEDLCSSFARAGLDRKSAVLALGGGVVGDLAGFAAAVYMRGIDFCQAPTTLLAMVDSSVGGKTGINIAEGKNLVGAFHQPRAVFADTDFLKTLPAREFAAGMAEVIKCGLLGDADFFRELESLPEPLAPSHPHMAEAIRRSCALKAAVVSGDECEKSPSGGRALLNLGHTFAHAIEREAGYGTYLHGEAVAVGTVMAAELSARLGTLCRADVERIKRLFTAYSLPVGLRSPIPAQNLLSAMRSDKKTDSGHLRFVVFDAIGSTRVQVVPESEVLEVLRLF